MSLYDIEIVNYSTVPGTWGDFTVQKAFDVFKKDPNNSSKKGTKSNIFGFILQKVEKQASVDVLCDNQKIKRIRNIEDFTSHQVKYLNHSYYELFPVVKGKSVHGDSFQNGQVLRYEKDSNSGIWYADNNPPTAGQIIQKGVFCFIPSDIGTVQRVLKHMKSKTTNTKIEIFGIEWDTNSLFPANGLPYTTSLYAPMLFYQAKSPMFGHLVVANWNGISGDVIQPTNILENISRCGLLSETNNYEIRSQLAKTQLFSDFVKY
jgi:hypothetical protein